MLRPLFSLGGTATPGCALSCHKVATLSLTCSNFAEVFVDFSLSPAIIDLVDNFVWSAGAVLPLFLFLALPFSSRCKSTKNTPFRINQLRIAISVSLFF